MFKMAGFDKTKDRQLWGETISFETTKITVAVYSYNHGEPKLQISRENLDPETAKWTFSKLGRLFEDEAVAIAKIYPKAVEELVKVKAERKAAADADK